MEPESKARESWNAPQQPAAAQAAFVPATGIYHPPGTALPVEFHLPDKRIVGPAQPSPIQPAQPMPVYIPNADKFLVAEIARLHGETAKFVAAVGRLRGYLESQDQDADEEGGFVRIDPDFVLNMFAGLVPGV